MKKEDKRITTRTYNNLLERLAEILNQARTNVVREINKVQVLTHWEIGREIVEFEQKGKERGEYGKRLIERLSEDMAKKFGRGFSPANLKMMRLFYRAYPIRQTLSDESFKKQKSETSSRKFLIQQTLAAKFEPQLSWSHYCELLKIEKLKAIPSLKSKRNG